MNPRLLDTFPALSFLRKQESSVVRRAKPPAVEDDALRLSKKKKDAEASFSQVIKLISD